MGENEAAELVGDIKAIRVHLEGIEKSLEKMGPMIDEHGRSIEVLKDRVEDLKRAKNWALTMILGAVLTSLMGLVLKR